MDNQHKQIKGYRDLSQAEIDAINAVKQKAEEVGFLVEELFANPDLDKRWISIAQTDLQKGFMALVRVIDRPESF